MERGGGGGLTGQEKYFTFSLREKRSKAKAEIWEGGKSQSEPSGITRDEEASLARGRRGSAGMPRLQGGRFAPGAHFWNAGESPMRGSRETRPRRSKGLLTWASFIPATVWSELMTVVVV